MSLELAEHSVQLLTCHRSRWRLCNCSQQDNQSKSWKKVWPLFFLSLITSHAVSTIQGRAYNFLYVIISRLRLCHRSPQDNQSKSRKKVWPLVFLSLGMVSMTPGNSLLLVFIRLGISSKAKKRMKIVPVCEAINSSRKVFFYPNIRCHASKLKRVVVLGGFHWHQQNRAHNFLYVIPADWGFAIVNHKMISTVKVYLYPYIQAINLNLRRRCDLCFFCHWSLLTLLAPEEQSIQLLIGARATTSLISYHQLKTWSLLSKDNQSKSWEKAWENWHCL